MPHHVDPAEVDRLAAEVEKAGALQVSGFDDSTLRFELDEDGQSVSAQFTLVFPGDIGSICAPVDLDPVEVEKLYRMTRLSGSRRCAASLTSSSMVKRRSPDC